MLHILTKLAVNLTQKRHSFAGKPVNTKFMEYHPSALQCIRGSDQILKLLTLSNLEFL